MAFPLAEPNLATFGIAVKAKFEAFKGFMPIHRLIWDTC